MRKDYYEFNPCIYPRLLWVVIGNTELVTENFTDRNHNELDEKDFCDCDGATSRARCKANDRQGSLIWIPSHSLDDVNTIAHEAVHATNFIFNDLEVDFNFDSDEHYAYMVGWVAGCVQMAINEYKKGG